MTVIYTTAWGDRIPSRDNLEDGCEFDYSPEFDIGKEVERETAEYRKQMALSALRKPIDEPRG